MLQRCEGGNDVNFELTKEQQMVREMVKDFAKKEIAPHAEHVDQTGEFPMQTFKDRKSVV